MEFDWGESNGKAMKNIPPTYLRRTNLKAVNEETDEDGYHCSTVTQNLVSSSLKSIRFYFLTGYLYDNVVN